MKNTILAYLNGIICIAAIFAILVIATMCSYGDLSNGNAWLLGALCVIIAAYSAYTASKLESGDE